MKKKTIENAAIEEIDSTNTQIPAGEVFDEKEADAEKFEEEFGNEYDEEEFEGDLEEEEFEEADGLSFASLPINPELVRAVTEMGFSSMTPIQAQAIPTLLEGRDVIGQAQTGTGKTAAFGLPLLDQIDPDLKELQAVILCPTRELAMQASVELHAFSKYMHGVRILPVYGGQDMVRQIKALKGCQVVVGTPGRVMDHMRRHTIKMDAVKVVVLDEADEMLDMGFREDMELILGEIQGQHQTCMFSATMPEPILELTKTYQKDAEMIRVTPVELTIPLVKQYYYPVFGEYKKQAVLRLLNCYRYQRCIIFCNTKNMVDELSAFLQAEGEAAEGLHGDLTQNQRDSVMGRFRGGNLKILIATDIAARGIDVDRVEAVINFDIPQESEYYVHRIGRTGRAGNEGVSHTLCRSSEFRKLHDIERMCHTNMEEKRIPGPDEIMESRKDAALEQAMAIIGEGKYGKYIPVVTRYCEEHDITLEMLAAAFIKKEVGEDVENLPINLPERSEKPARRRRRDGSSYSRSDQIEGSRDRRRRRWDDEEDSDGRRRRRRHEEDSEERRGRRGHRDEERDFISRKHQEDKRAERHGDLEEKKTSGHRNSEKERGRKVLDRVLLQVEKGWKPEHGEKHKKDHAEKGRKDHDFGKKADAKPRRKKADVRQNGSAYSKRK